MINDDIIASIQRAKHSGQLKFTGEGLKRSIERDIVPSQIKQALDSSGVEIIPDSAPPHPNNPSPACLVLGTDEFGRALHTVVAYRTMLIVTTYEPTLPWWTTPRKRAPREGV